MEEIMASLKAQVDRVFVSAMALTGTTEYAARRFGAAPFLPALFIDRFTYLGGIEPAVFSAQLAACRSFDDDRWAQHWQGYATEHLMVADGALSVLGAPSTRQLLDAPSPEQTHRLGGLLAPAVEILADRGAIAPPGAVSEFSRRHPESLSAAVALDALIKAVVYEFAAAWPGWTPSRLRAYETSHRLCEIVLTALAPAMGLAIEMVRIPCGDDDEVRGYLVAPEGADQLPTVLITNGLEGSLAETTLPLLKYRDEGMAYFIMEMPGTYHYRQPLTAQSEQVYRAVIDYLAAHNRVDTERMGMLGVSFGAYWATRMAAVEPRLCAVVANGAPADRSLAPSGSLGVPEVIVSTIQRTIGAGGLVDMMGKVKQLTLRDHLPRITLPLLVINGAKDTLVRVEDSVDIATYAPNAQLVLYADDDHCAMKNAEAWFGLAVRFLREQLATPVPS